MPILQRFLLAFGLIIGIGAVQSATTVFSLGTLSSELDAATTVPIAQVDAAWRASDAFLRADSFLAGALDGIRDQPNTETIARFKALAAPIEAELGRALANSSGSKPLVDAIGQWKASALVLLGGAPAVSIPSPHVMEKRGLAIRAALQGLVSDALANSAAARTTIQAQALRTEALTVIFAVAAIVVGIGIAVPSALTLTRPLQRLQARMRSMTEGDLDSPITEGGRADEIGHIAKALHFMRDRLAERRRMEGEAAAAHREAEQRLHATEAAFAAAGREQAEIVRQLGLALDRIARGDLTTRITEDVPREYAKLKGDFNKSIGSIQAAVASVASTTDELRDGSEDMAQAAVDSSRRSEQQAARLQHAASSLNAISDAIRGTAASTREASKVISAANADADRSSAMMQDAVGAISRIEESSGQITRIIGVIDEIAFQTNILALNAAIEAARAGEGGRGFSIVAAEVRALAQRSAGAAKEIKGLITQTSISVKDGADLIGRTGEVIGVIMGKVAAIDKLVGSVATAAEQQAAGLHGVVDAVSEADQATQQDLKVSGHAAESVQALRDQAMSLADLLGRFTVEDTQASARPRHVAA